MDYSQVTDYDGFTAPFDARSSGAFMPQRGVTSTITYVYWPQKRVGCDNALILILIRVPIQHQATGFSCQEK